MSDMRIRSATIEDLDALLKLENECFTADRISRRSYRNFLKTSSAEIIIAMQDKTIAGAVVVLFRKNSTKARWYSFAISEKFRRGYLTTVLFESVEEVARRRQCDRIILEVRAANKGVIAMYERHHYETFGVYKQYYNDGVDAIRMQKWIIKK